nr:unnamed protein product [Spirometra erinaceieuropaei]
MTTPLEATADKPGKLEIPRPGQTNVEENIEYRLNNRRSQSHHSSRQVQSRDMQKSTVVLVSAAASQRHHPIISNMSTMSSSILDANWTFWTPPVRLRHTDCTNPRLSSHPSRTSHKVN